MEQEDNTKKQISKSNVVCYFSGTGNSMIAAKHIAKNLNDSEVCQINAELFEKYNSIKCDQLILIIPSYAYGLPISVRKFIKTFAISASYVAVAVTYGSHYGGTLASAKAMFRRKKIKVNYCGGIRAVENFIPIFGQQSEKKIRTRLVYQGEDTQKFVSAVQDKQVNKILMFRPISAFVSWMFRTFSPALTKCYKVNDKCTGCKICEKACPSKAICVDPESNKAKFVPKNCDQCQCCINVCPVHAIEFARHKAKTKQYLNPEVNTKDLIKR